MQASTGGCPPQYSQPQAIVPQANQWVDAGKHMPQAIVPQANQRVDAGKHMPQAIVPQANQRVDAGKHYHTATGNCAPSQPTG